MLKELATVGVKIAEKARPPGFDANPKEVMKWRWLMAIGVVMNGAALMIHILLACGLTPFFGGFAYADEVRSNTIEILEQRLWDMKTRECDAVSQEARRLYSQKVSDLQKKYHELMGYDLKLPTCQELE